MELVSERDQLGSTQRWPSGWPPRARHDPARSNPLPLRPPLAMGRWLGGRILLQLLSKQLSSTSLSLQTRLLGIDSLAVLTLCRQLRLAVPSLCLRPQEVRGFEHEEEGREKRKRVWRSLADWLRPHCSMLFSPIPSVQESFHDPTFQPIILQECVPDLHHSMGSLHPRHRFIRSSNAVQWRICSTSWISQRPWTPPARRRSRRPPPHRPRATSGCRAPCGLRPGRRGRERRRRTKTAQTRVEGSLVRSGVVLDVWFQRSH